MFFRQGAGGSLTDPALRGSCARSLATTAESASDSPVVANSGSGQAATLELRVLEIAAVGGVSGRPGLLGELLRRDLVEDMGFHVRAVLRVDSALELGTAGDPIALTAVDGPAGPVRVAKDSDEIRQLAWDTLPRGREGSHVAEVRFSTRK